MEQNTELNRSLNVSEHDVSHFPAFEEMQRPELEHVLSLAKLKRVTAGGHLFHSGEQAEAFFLLVEGYARLLRETEEGDQLVLHHVAPGCLFGITQVTASPRYSVSAKAVSDCLVLVWRADLWETIVADSPSFARDARRTLGTRMRELADKVVELATRTVEQRVALALLQMTERAGRKTAAGTEIGFPVTRQDIADTTGANMHSVSRIMSAWQRQQIVSGSRRKVVVLKPKVLSQLVQGTTGS
ncbi:MAG: Crp/Fnr family transcriptional regulator [Pseudomonadota bacterium]